MDEIVSFEDNLKDRHFAFLASDVAKLTSEEGCGIQLEEKVTHYNIDEESFSDEEEELGVELDCSGKETKVERMKREFLSLTLNANRDPVDHKTASKLPDLFNIDLSGGGEDDDSEIYDFSKSDNGYTSVHKRYRNLGNYEDMINKGDNFFEPLSDAKLVYKRIVRPGCGTMVDKNSIVIYNCALWTEGAREPFDSTWLRHNTFVTDLSSDSILPGIYSLLLTMKSGEWAEAFIRPQAAFGLLGVMPRIPPKAVIFCLLEISKVISQDKIDLISYDPTRKQMNGVGFEHLYAAADEARRRGNHYHDMKQYKVALQRYKSGIRILEALIYKDEHEESKAKQLLVKLFNNTARAANASNQSRFALGCCKRASLLNDMDPKTHWNRMVAWKSMGHIDRALGSARRAMQIFNEPKTRLTFRREAEVLKKELLIQQAKSDDMFRAMGRALAG